MNSCELCDLITGIESGDRPLTVARTRTGYVSLAACQYYRGYTYFLAKTCVPELHLLPANERRLFLDEMALVAESVFRAFESVKLNYELLGNGVPHLHWHLFPRHADDPKPRGPVREGEAFLKVLHAEEGRLSEDEIVRDDAAARG